jgi:hypothetical protein
MIIVLISLLLIGFAIWTVSSINEKLELLIRIQVKKEDTHFNDKDLNEELDKYRDK